MAIWQEISRQISAATGQPFCASIGRTIGGGCINATYLIEDRHRCFFVKTNRPSGLAMFEAEADGLRELAAAGAIRVPEPVCSGLAQGSAFLVLEFIDFSSGTPNGAEKLGRQLAALHHHAITRFGWHRDNTIGSTPQSNIPTENWAEFWRDRRLGYQLALAAKNGYGGALQRQGERLQLKLGAFFAAHAPQPSLLHGDLWGGNYGFDREGAPVLFDPAVYYGDREADLAMTELFGGFQAAFYAAYEEAFPLDEGYRVRKTLYNLYHILNHLNLFGGGYLGQAERMIAQLLSEVG